MTEGHRIGDLGLQVSKWWTAQPSAYQWKSMKIDARADRMHQKMEIEETV